MRNVKLCYYYNSGCIRYFDDMNEIRDVMFDIFNNGYIVKYEISKDIFLLLKTEDLNYILENKEYFKNFFESIDDYEFEELEDGSNHYEKFNVTVYKCF